MELWDARWNISVALVTSLLLKYLVEKFYLVLDKYGRNIICLQIKSTANLQPQGSGQLLFFAGQYHSKHEHVIIMSYPEKSRSPKM